MASELKPAWYILTYHNVAWEDGPLLRAVGGTCPPDIFRDHVRACAALGRLVSIREGLERLRGGAIDEPQISFWFDDGLSGVSRHAAPILADSGVTAAQSICSRFTARAEMFWRFKLSYLRWMGADRELRARLAEFGLEDAELLRHFTLDRFGPEVLAAIDEVYGEVVGATDQERAFGIFDTPEALLALRQAGWVLANHSAAHFPIGEPGSEDLLLPQFLECDRFLESLTGEPNEFWVLPFGREIEISALAEARDPARRWMVLMQDKANLPNTAEASDLIFRIHAPTAERRLNPAFFQKAYRNACP